LAGVWTDRDGDGEYEDIPRYEWTDRMLTVTTTRAGGLANAF